MKRAFLAGLLVVSLPIFPITFREDEVSPIQLSLETLPSDGAKALVQWVEEARGKLGDLLANSFVLSTVSQDGKPSSRVMTSKFINENGIIVYGNANSQKFQQIQRNPSVSVTFYWPDMQRALTMRGFAVKLSDKEAQAYFATRPRHSQAASHASSQSSPLQTREMLLNKHKQTLDQYEGKQIPAPQTWAGYRLVPTEVELWQAGAFTLHQRISYQKNKKGDWQATLLQP